MRAWASDGPPPLFRRVPQKTDKAVVACRERGALAVGRNIQAADGPGTAGEEDFAVPFCRSRRCRRPSWPSAEGTSRCPFGRRGQERKWFLAAVRKDSEIFPTHLLSH